MDNRSQKHADLPGIWHLPLRRLIILTVSLIIASSTAYTAWKTCRSRQIIIRSAELQTQANARSLKEHTERAFSEIDYILKGKIRQIEQSGRLSHARLTSILKEDIQNIPQISSLGFADPSGRLVAISLCTEKSLTCHARQYNIQGTCNGDRQNRGASGPSQALSHTALWFHKASGILENSGSSGIEYDSLP